jgi:hypothetical protein
MVKKLFTLFLLSAFCLTAFAGERVLVRIGEGGKQEAIQLKKGESAQAAIERLEQQRASLYKASNSAGLIDTLKYYNSAADLTTNFGWTHQDLAFQWYIPQAKGTVKEFWWLNYLNRGVINKGTIRAWHINPRVEGFPASPNTKFIGAYKDATDGDGGVQPFKPASGNQWFYSNGAADSVIYSFDMFTKEAAWLAGGLQVTLDSNKWQGIKLEDWGDSMNVNLGEHFGFTLTNDTKKSDFGAGTDTRMEILAVAAAGAPYHSYKYYETGRTAPANAGWHMRGDYEWGMYVVIEYTGDRAPKISGVPAYGTTLSTSARPMTATITDDNPGGGAAGVAAARVFSKIGVLAKYDSVAMTNTGSSYTGNAKAAAAGDTVYWYIGAVDVNGNRATTPARSYVIFRKTKPYLFIYNNAGFSRSNANLIYNGTSSPKDFDYWSSPSDGTSELPTLLALYNDISVVDGNFPARNVYTALHNRLKAATAGNQVAVFFSSQDYGCYIESNCADTTFAAGAMELDFFGVTKIGTQDLPPTAREFKLVPQTDAVTDYLIKFGTDSGSTLWYDPTFELGFAGYQDAMTFRAEAKPLFKDGAGTNVLGGKYISATTRAMFVGFDIGSMQFRSDTALAAGSDPKYKWVPTDVGSLSNKFFEVHHVTSVKPVNGIVPGEFQLGQNYPNPFNPSTTIEYKVPARANVEIAIFNILGQKVATVVNDVHEAGSHRATWNGRDLSGKLAASGVYFYSLKSGSFEQVKKMMLMK